MNAPSWVQEINWQKSDGLIPAIVQHHLTGQVLMLAYMNEQALHQTLESNKVTFFSRSKQRLWTKGETSGHFLSLVSVCPDCDKDTLLVLAKPQGPVCHLMTPTCFGEDAPQGAMLSRLEEIIDQRAQAKNTQSYTQSLLAEGTKRCAQKVGEEGVEVALAALGGDLKELEAEAADLLYHLLVALESAGSSLDAVLAVLDQRHQPDQ